jgi:hypothetical protein
MSCIAARLPSSGFQRAAHPARHGMARWIAIKSRRWNPAQAGRCRKRFRVLLATIPGATKRLPDGDCDAPDHCLTFSNDRALELILHGHLQKGIQITLPGPNGGIPVYGAGSFSLGKRPNTGHFFGFFLEDQGTALQLSVHQFEYQPMDDAFSRVSMD